MRTLTAKQKRLLKEWFNKNYNGGCKFNLADKLIDDDIDLYDKIEKIHPTEIHYQNVNSFLEELVNNR